MIFVKLGSTAIGLKTKEGVVLAVEKRITSPLLVCNTCFPFSLVCLCDGMEVLLLPFIAFLLLVIFMLFMFIWFDDCVHVFALDSLITMGVALP